MSAAATVAAALSATKYESGMNISASQAAPLMRPATPQVPTPNTLPLPRTLEILHSSCPISNFMILRWLGRPPGDFQRDYCTVFTLRGHSCFSPHIPPPPAVSASLSLAPQSGLKARHSIPALKTAFALLSRCFRAAFALLSRCFALLPKRQGS
jgi:hypothetical protein